MGIITLSGIIDIKCRIKTLAGSYPGDTLLSYDFTFYYFIDKLQRSSDSPWNETCFYISGYSFDIMDAYSDCPPYNS